MPLPKLNLSPGQGSYSVTPEPDTLRANMGAGPSRFRRDMIGAISTVSVSWACTRIQYQYVESFFRSTVPGSLPFLCDLIIDSPDVSEYEARLIPGSKRLSSVRGHQRTVEAMLEVRPVTPDAPSDEGFVALYGEYGDDTEAMLRLLGELTTVTMPVTLV